MIELERDGEVFIVRMDDNENRFSPQLLDELDEALGTVEAHDGPKALVTTGTGKFFSNGLDLDWLSAHSSEAGPYLDRVHRLFARVLSMPCLTVAAANGHTFAAGAMLSICHDHRIMRSDRGYWCLPEVDLEMSFTPAMNALIPALVPARAAHQAMVTGRRFTAREALQAGLIDQVADEADVVSAAVAHAGSLAAKGGPVMATIRTTLHAPLITALTDGFT